MRSPFQFDVVVLGGGSAGVAAAISAAKSGVRVALVERHGFLGGMATSAQVGTICGHYFRSDSAEFHAAHSGFADQFCSQLAAASKTTPLRWKDGLAFLPYDPIQFRFLCDRLLKESAATLFFHSTLTHIEHETSGWTLGVVCWDKNIKIHTNALVDCTGEASAVAFAGLSTIESSNYQSGAVVFSLHGVLDKETTLLRLEITKAISQAIHCGALPAELDKLSVVPGSHRNAAISFKLGLPGQIPDQANKMSSLELQARELVAAVSLYLTQHVEAFKHAFLANLATHVGVRTGRRGKGLFLLEEHDVLTCKKHSDAVAQGVWPIEIWHDTREPLMKFFPAESGYDIPAGALISADSDSLFLAGRNISAAETAIASARVIGTCLATGYAAGALAASRSLGADLKSTIQNLQSTIIREDK